MGSDSEWIGMTDRQRLIQLFDAAYSCKCDLILWQHDEADAPEALGSWAAGREVVIEARRVDISSSDVVLDVPMSRGRITVYCRRAGGEKVEK